MDGARMDDVRVTGRLRTGKEGRATGDIQIAVRPIDE